MRTRSSFVMATLAWPLPLVAVAARADGRSVAAGLAWAGFVGLGAWSVIRLFGGHAVVTSGVAGLPPATIAGGRDVGTGEVGTGDAGAAAERELVTGHAARDGVDRSASAVEAAVPGVEDAAVQDGPAPDELDVAAEGAEAGIELESERAEPDDQPGFVTGEPGDEPEIDELGLGCDHAAADIAAGLARLEAFANGDGSERCAALDDEQAVAGDPWPLLGGADD